MIRRLVVLLAAGLVLGGLAAAPAAAGAPLVKTNVKDLTFDVEGPSCEGTYFAGTVTAHEVITIQMLDNGRFFERFQYHANGSADLAYYEWDGVTPPDTSTAEPVYNGTGRYTSAIRRP